MLDISNIYICATIKEKKMIKEFLMIKNYNFSY